jgi:hypothetical protein
MGHVALQVTVDADEDEELSASWLQGNGYAQV